MNKIKKMVLLFLDHFNLLNNVADEKYLKLMFEARNGYRLNLDHPTTFNEKIQWLKLNDKREIYSIFVDKYEVKKYISQTFGDQILVPTLGIWDKFDDIDFDKLPDKFVLKCTHDSGGNVICKDKAQFDKKRAKKKINKCLKKKFYLSGREYQYKGIKPRIIAEEYIEDKATNELIDYKFFSFDGKVKAMFVATGRQSKEGVHFDFFDEQFNHLPIFNGHPMNKITPKKPNNFDLMIKTAETISKGYPHLRVDFYEANGKMYFGEITLYQNSGLVPFTPLDWDVKFGSWITIV